MKMRNASRSVKVFGLLILFTPSTHFAEGYGSGTPALSSAALSGILSRATKADSKNSPFQQETDIDKSLQKIVESIGGTVETQNNINKWAAVRGGFENIWKNKERIAIENAERAQRKAKSIKDAQTLTAQLSQTTSQLQIPMDKRDVNDLPEGCDDGGVKGSLNQLEQLGNQFKSSADSLQTNLNQLLTKQGEEADRKSLAELDKLFKTLEENESKEAKFDNEQKKALASLGPDSKTGLTGSEAALSQKENDLKKAQKGAAKSLRDALLKRRSENLSAAEQVNIQNQFVGHMTGILNQVASHWQNGTNTLGQNCQDLKDAARISDLQTRREAEFARAGNIAEIIDEGAPSGKVGRIVRLLGTSRTCEDITPFFESTIGTQARQALTFIGSGTALEPAQMLQLATGLFTNIASNMPIIMQDVNRLARSCKILDKRVQEGKNRHEELTSQLKSAVQQGNAGATGTDSRSQASAGPSRTYPRSHRVVR